LQEVLSIFEEKVLKGERRSIVCKPVENVTARYTTIYQDESKNDVQLSWDNFKRLEETPSKSAEEPSALTYTEISKTQPRSPENNHANVCTNIDFRQIQLFL
jgi:hypothetical protein